MTGPGHRPLTLRDGRVLDARDTGPQGALVLVPHHATPGTGTPSAEIATTVAERGARLVTWSRPGHATSPRYPGPSVAGVAGDAVEVLGAFGVDTTVTAGASGGGPHALACGPLRPDRSRAVAPIAGVAAHIESLGTLDWNAGMGMGNVADFGAAARGESASREFLAAYGQELATIGPEQILSELDTLLPDVDRRYVTAACGESLATSFCEAVGHGIDGVVDDDLAVTQPGGVDVGALEVPVHPWQGSADLMVAFAPGPWLAAVPGGRAHPPDGEGHLSIGVGHAGEIDDLVRAET